ncbi:ROK family protein [Agrilactobacillus composti DSM 18527 = JCM 14202]|uniref:ROK family protein n=1 Tax=Agrilactobacillus composti DSM 18527 = JCM 14202 TaxID=1423734 RepID=X0QJJ9_9LACO|nr:ROK family protein [Agrilactobacillus composti]KRM34917.1 ROK family protein [Agrilactobacillus composti DSM 18527 = JCM 14202]GAF38800.1 N-acetylmannosamine kinase [Agrilactobacillus composti DSM 18527 = JCM 14202]
MENVVAIDVGGTTIKYACWQSNSKALMNKGYVKTPRTLAKYYEILQRIVAEFEIYDPVGVALSTPGAVNLKTGVVAGISALPYIHNFPLQQALTGQLGLPVTLENDANCAALAELDSGAAREYQNVIVLVIGTGVGGAVVSNRQIQRGAHLLAGEFGLMRVLNNRPLSQVGTAVSLARRYNLKAKTRFSGQEILELANQGDLLAQKEAAVLYRSLAEAIYNLEYSFDPELFILGGGISENPQLIPNIQRSLVGLTQGAVSIPVPIEIVPCHYYNDANLMGAVVHFNQTMFHERKIKND